jgi:protein gp37
MSAKTSISWTDHTFNPWWGCTKVSEGCAHCYAADFAVRTGYSGKEKESGKAVQPVIWGKDAPRRFFPDKHWNEPVEWNRTAKALVESDSAPSDYRPRVFCASMADVFEDRRDLDAPRLRLLQLIDDTPHLDWLLLTKRPASIKPLLERVSNGNMSDFRHMPNVWLGTTVETQKQADQRIPHLVGVKARVRFLSVEPMLERINLRYLIDEESNSLDALTGNWGIESCGQTGPTEARVHWVICGGESGGQRRPFDVDWAWGLAGQCAAAGVPFHMKQDGAFKSGQQGRIPEALWARKEFPKL